MSPLSRFIRAMDPPGQTHVDHRVWWRRHANALKVAAVAGLFLLTQHCEHVLDRRYAESVRDRAETLLLQAAEQRERARLLAVEAEAMRDAVACARPQHYWTFRARDERELAEATLYLRRALDAERINQLNGGNRVC